MQVREWIMRNRCASTEGALAVVIRDVQGRQPIVQFRTFIRESVSTDAVTVMEN
jgi:hypothetical protein